MESLGSLPEHIKARILSHFFKPGPPAALQEQEAPASSFQHANATIPAAMRGKSLAQGPIVCDDFVPPARAQALLEEARRLVEQNARAAGMGGAAADAKWSDSKYRGDTIVFLHPDRLAAQGCAALAAFLAATASELRPWLERQGYDVGGRPTFQLGCYPGGGARYVRHRDASLTCPHRTVTALLYLRPGWRPEDGGELCIYHLGTSPIPRAPGQGSAAAGGAAPAQEPARAEPAVLSGLQEGHAATVVPPLAGRLVLFDSRTQHEVLPSFAPRYALAIWFTRPPAAAAGDEQQPGGQAAERLPVAAAAEQPKPAPEPAQRLRQTEARTAEQSPAPPAAARGRRASYESFPGPALDAERITRPGQIFVSIASYRDSETQWTLLDLFRKAQRPELVRAGVVWQVDWAQDAHFVRIAPGGEAWMPQVRQVVIDRREATGPCKARALAQALWDGEEFYLQIDSHMRFVEGWDVQLLGMLCQAEQHAQHGRVVLSSYPPGYQGEGPAAVLPQDPPTTLLCATHFDADGMLRIKGRALREAPPQPLPSLFWAAGLSFSRAQLLQEVPYDPSLAYLFFGEEMLQLVRMWLRGWDVYAPICPVAFHLWSRAHRPTMLGDAGAAAGTGSSGSSSDSMGDAEAEGGAAPAVGAGVRQQQEGGAALRRRSQQRVLEALGAVAGLDGSNAGSTAQGAEPVPGRSLADFWRHCRVDFGAWVVGEQAKWGGLGPEAFQPSLKDILEGFAQLAA